MKGNDEGREEVRVDKEGGGKTVKDEDDDVAFILILSISIPGNLVTLYYGFLSIYKSLCARQFSSQF